MVALKAPIPVYIAYFTAGVDAGGKIRFSNDIYGRDALKSLAWRPPRKRIAGRELRGPVMARKMRD
jgi:murein L,D-transpeptidase YcbB/YkuD